MTKRSYTSIWKPQPKQSLALSCPATELFFGGAAGGGKSDFMLADFMQGAAKYGKNWNGIIFRQTTNQLEQLQKRAQQLFPKLGGRYVGKGSKEGSNMWVFENGATLKMRYLESDKDVDNYQGHEYTWIGIDELGNYPTPYCWEFMKSRLRSPVGVPCYIRGTANPGGTGHGWIKQRFMDNHEPNKIFYIERVSQEGKVFKDTACFIPSRLEDNAVLMKNDPQYEARLLSLPAHLARAMRYGDWSVFEGQIFDIFNVATHVVKPFQLAPGEWFKFCAMDWGFSRPFSIGWYAVNSQGRVIRYKEFYGCQKDQFNTGLKMGSIEVAQKAWEMSILEGVNTMVADPAIWNKADNAPSVCENFQKVGWKMIKGNNDRKNGLVQVYNYMKQAVDENGTPMLTVFPNCFGFIRTIPMLQPDANDMEDVDTQLEDHIYDEVRYALMSDFVGHPTTALRRQNGSWERTDNNQESYNPLDNI